MRLTLRSALATIMLAASTNVYASGDAAMFYAIFFLFLCPLIGGWIFVQKNNDLIQKEEHKGGAAVGAFIAGSLLGLFVAFIILFILSSVL